MLSDQERLARLRLIRSDGIGPIIFRQLLQRFGAAPAAIAALPDLARRGGRSKPLRVADAAEAEAELARTEACGARLAWFDEADYPPRLAALEDAPPVLALRGRAELGAMPALAVVGARNASALGMRFTRAIAGELGAAGLAIVSGLARGIDAAAHEAALASGTVAVLGTGIDMPYPRENAGLYDRIAAAGLLLSEVPAGTDVHARNFPRRNRIISGVAMGVLVVEAALQSGSLITARLALEQGREVFAVPGSPLDPRARGCNKLLREGATLVEEAADVLRELAPMSAAARRLAAAPLPAIATPPETTANERDAVLALLGPGPVHADELARQSGLAPALLGAVLLDLELGGLLQRHPGGKVSSA